MTIPAMAPPDKDLEDDEFSTSAASLSGATIGVDVTVSVTGSPEMVTTRVLVTGEGVADSGIDDELVHPVVESGSSVDDVEDGGGGVELELDVVRGGGDEDCGRAWSA